MNRVLINFGILSALVVLSLGRTTPGQVLWFPNDEGTGMVPAILNEVYDPEDIPSDKANPNNIHFYLWTHNNVDKKDEIENTTASIDGSHWDRNAPVKVVSHGFSSTSVGGASGDIKNGYIKDGYPTNVNVVMIDWGWLAAAPWYDVAAGGTKLVGHKTAYLLDFLVRNGYTTPDKIHIVGHSLGSHVAGYAGTKFFELNGAKIARITALDPALPRFGVAKDADRIDPTDAEYVVVVHTNAGSLLAGNLGFREPRGHFDVYPNKGSSQPGCGGALELIAICSHMRAATLYREAINSNSFRASKCNDDDYGFGQFKTCHFDNGEGLLSEDSSSEPRGIYYLKTNKITPFAQG